MTTVPGPHRSARVTSHSPPRLGGKITRTDPRSSKSGFSDLIEQEHRLKTATESCRAGGDSPQADAVDRMLREHAARLETNLTVLKQRHQTRRPSAGFEPQPGPGARLDQTGSGAGPDATTSMLQRLSDEHQALITTIAGLLTRGSDRQRGQLILKQVARNHAEMAAMIAALVGAEPMADPAHLPTIAAANQPTGDERGENDGGALPRTVADPARVSPRDE